MRSAAPRPQSDAVHRPVLSHGDVRLVPMSDCYREALRAVCSEDREIWDIYSYSMLGEGFDDFWNHALLVELFWVILHENTLVGCSAIVPDERAPGVVEIGGTYLAPSARGTGVNRIVKWLMLSHAFAFGAHRVEFRVDARNQRSRAAVARIGAVEEGVLRRHKMTHTGHVRDTHVFAITDLDWPAVEERLRP